MIRLLVFNILFFLGLPSVIAQSGLIIELTNTRGQSVEGCIVILSNNQQAISNDKGLVEFPALAAGIYTLQTRSFDYKPVTETVEIGQLILKKSIILHPRNETLNEVIITDESGDYNRTRMRSIEKMGIYEGKKSEVIVMNQLVANLATNNARQVYSRVPGLNIWENDGAGIQLSIGGRGLDPNRTANFNVRQNGYDISADALGYPESYYTPPAEAIERIQVVRGAASLQYGTQFGGLLNFVMKQPNENRKAEVIARQSVGSFGFYNAFTSVSGSTGKFSYYSYYQYKKGNGWRPNSQFDNKNFFINLNYQFNPRSKLGIEYTFMDYLSKQPGGLTDAMFADNPRQSNRDRNWFQVNWNLLALHYDFKISDHQDLNIRAFGLSASRYSLGFRPNRVATIDDNSERDLLKGQFENRGAETRYLHRYELLKKPAVFLAGMRVYHGNNHEIQGLGSTGSDANFNFISPEKFTTYDYKYPNNNVSFFAENIWYVSKKVSITPGFRAEYINTKADGFYGFISKDLAGNIINITTTNEQRQDVRKFIITGVGISYKPNLKQEFYGNISQNYRSITFSDMRVNNPSSVIDQNLKDEKGFSFDLGTRSNGTGLFNYDIGLFYMDYSNRIGEVQFVDANNRILRLRTNIGRAVVKGIEAYTEANVIKFITPNKTKWTSNVFANVALIQSEYKTSLTPGVTGNKLEFVPAYNIKIGGKIGYNKLLVSYQYTLVADQFSDASNAPTGGPSSVIGTIPAYNIHDLSMSYEWSRFKFEMSVNNLTNSYYFTRRATGYPGPGILPSDGRGIYATVQIKI